MSYRTGIVGNLQDRYKELKLLDYGIFEFLNNYQVPSSVKCTPAENIGRNNVEVRNNLLMPEFPTVLQMARKNEKIIL
jgi:hypothetical protein